jgi:hypothetical protein
VGFIRKDLLEAHLFNTTFFPFKCGYKSKAPEGFFLKTKHEKKEEKKILTIKR